MSKYTLKKEDIQPLLSGLTIYGTGGGGEAEFGKVILDNEFSQGRICQIVSPEDIADTAFVCSGGIMGSVKALENVGYEQVVEGWETDFPLVNTVRTMEKLCGRKVEYMVPFEVGALNTPVIMSACARLGIPMIDGDGNGRSAPETQMTCFIGHGINLYPMPLSDREGNITIVLSANAETYADEVGRFLVVKGGNMGANAHYPMDGRQLKAGCVPHTVTAALSLGKALVAGGENGVETVCAHFQGKELFTGTICSIQGMDKGGFYLTDCQMIGTGKWKGHSGKMVIKNETMALWVDGEIKIMFPDRLLMLEPATGQGIPSVVLQEGMELILVGAPCHPRIAEFIQTPVGQRCMGAARYGYGELQYQPFELR